MAYREEVVQSVYGAWRIARMDPDAMRHFNLTIEGFGRSFGAAVIVAPFVVLTGLLVMPEAPVGAEALPEVPDQFTIAWQRLLLFALQWLLFVLLMIPMSRLLDLTATYVSFIIAWNWGSVIGMAVIFPVAVLFGAGLLPESAGVLLMLLAQIAVLFYRFLLARVALGCGAGMAAGVVALEFVLDLLLAVGAERWL